jgi:hypothetical protein
MGQSFSNLYSHIGVFSRRSPDLSQGSLAGVSQSADAYLASLANAQGKFLEDTASTQQRLTGINDSSRKRRWRYVQIAGWVVFWMVNLVLAQMLPAFLPFVPEAVWTWHMVFVSLFVGYMVMVILMELSQRSVINYDELEMSNVVDASGIPLTLDQGNATANKKDGYDLSQLLANKTTCGTGTVYDATTGQCVGDPNDASMTGVGTLADKVLYQGTYQTLSKSGGACSGATPIWDQGSATCVAQCPVGMQSLTAASNRLPNVTANEITSKYGTGICADVIETFTTSKTDATTTGQASIPESMLLRPLPVSEGFHQPQPRQQECQPCATSGEPSVERQRLITPLPYVDDGLLPYNAV